jgi:hypothetical protein
MRAKIESIQTNRWGHTYVHIKKGKEIRQYLLGGFEGEFEIDIRVPNELRAPRAYIKSVKRKETYNAGRDIKCKRNNT